MNLDWDSEFKITFLVASSKELPPHFATIGKSKILGNKEHGPCTFELACTTIWKDPMLLGPYAMINNPMPMLNKNIASTSNVEQKTISCFFVITNIKMGFLNYSRLTISLTITKFASRLDNIMHVLSCNLITCLHGDNMQPSTTIF
jgi:hypothetical protein